ncbi:unnamed protein product [Allacma fusca]|uniref:WAP domain-containing protein n=1 Tax=Allacma fusca TaxID=39272 RepID=A0A8J2JP65_9HEXA|nr:unnamed protein product [Allacma fusca]
MLSHWVSWISILFLGIVYVRLSSCSDDINLYVVEDVCPVGNTTVVTKGYCNYNKKFHCLSDDQCKIGSKCCAHKGPCKKCVDLKDGSLSRPKVQVEFAKKQRRKRQSYGCVSCSCVRSCRTDADCARYRNKRRCYHNSCSSYCVR